jgi:hypothetical protein
LTWIPQSLIGDDWKTALPEAYLEIARERRPNSSRESRQNQAESLADNPAYSLMLILNMIRNRMHPGRWVRERHELQSEDAFSAWAQVAIVAAAHIRDCLLEQHQAALVEYLRKLMTAKLAKTVPASGA